MSRLRLLPALLVALVALAACGGEKRYQRELEGEIPPSLDTTAVTWLNSEPLTLSALRGKVVYLEFGFRG